MSEPALSRLNRLMTLAKHYDSNRDPAQAMNELRRRRLSLTMVASMLRARSHNSVCGAVRRVKWMMRAKAKAA